MEMTLTDGESKVLLLLQPTHQAMTSGDFLFDVLALPGSELVAKGILPAGQRALFESIVSKIFDRDDQGLFIREGIRFTGQRGEVSPETHLSEVGNVLCLEALQSDRMKEYHLWFFLHMLAMGRPVDVIRVDPELEGVIEDAERQSLVEIDTQKALYRLTSAGDSLHRHLLGEAQDLIKRFDIFADVLLSPEIRFKTGFGQDLRISAWEHAGVDPFRARFLIGLSDGEWDEMPDWEAASNSEQFYDEVFAPVEQAPSVADIGEQTLSRIQEKASAVLREEW